MIIAKRMISSGFIQGVLVLLGGSILAQTLPIILTPILTRLYTAEDMGMFALFASFISFASGGISLGYSKAIGTGRTDTEAVQLAALSMLAIAPMALISILIQYLLITRNWLGYGVFPLWVPLILTTTLVLSGIFTTLRYWLIRIGHYKLISTASVAQSIMKAVTQILTGIVGMAWIGLILGELIGRTSGISRMWAVSRDRLGQEFGVEKWSDLKLVAHQYIKFPLLAVPSSLLNSLALVLPVPMITVIYGIDAAGQFAVASRVLLLPLSLIGSSVGDVFHTRIGNISRESPDRALRFFWRVVVGLLAIGVVPMGIVLLFSEPLFITILGPQWRQAGEISSVLVPWILLQFIVSPITRVVHVYQGQEWKLIFDILAFCSVAGVLSLGGYQDWSLTQSMTILGWSQALVYGLNLLLMRAVIGRNRNINVN